MTLYAVEWKSPRDKKWRVFYEDMQSSEPKILDTEGRAVSAAKRIADVYCIETRVSAFKRTSYGRKTYKGKGAK